MLQSGKTNTTCVNPYAGQLQIITAIQGTSVCDEHKKTTPLRSGLSVPNNPHHPAASLHKSLDNKIIRQASNIGKIKCMQRYM